MYHCPMAGYKHQRKGIFPARIEDLMLTYKEFNYKVLHILKIPDGLKKHSLNHEADENAQPV